ncbi:MAG: hypothetical protein RIQ93_2470 [Verrucomicrobiota bacterium]|jgi:hypothetical protein
MQAFLLFAPLFLVFEIWQLVICERYLGIKQIARGADPRALNLGETTAFFWTSAIVLYWFWMLLLLMLPNARLHGLGLLMISGIGFSLRRGAPLKSMLVILTFEGATRIVFLTWLTIVAWRGR